MTESGLPFVEGLSVSYQNAPWLFCGTVICAIVWVVLLFAKRKKKKATLEDEENNLAISRLDDIHDTIMTELSVPSDSKEVDVLFFHYKVKDGEIKVHGKATQMVQYLNLVFNIYADEENLYLANLECKYAFPLSSLKTIRTIKKRIHLPEWNKEEAFNKGIYKKYKLVSDKYGFIHCKSYHILELTHNGENYGIYFPNYELPIFEEVTGLKAE